LALTQQGVVLEPLLQAISDFLDDHEGLITTIQGDLRRGLKNPDTGGKGLTARQILRALVLMHGVSGASQPHARGATAHAGESSG
jgi:hypothetical protein